MASYGRTPTSPDSYKEQDSGVASTPDSSSISEASDVPRFPQPIQEKERRHKEEAVYSGPHMKQGEGRQDDNSSKQIGDLKDEIEKLKLSGKTQANELASLKEQVESHEELFKGINITVKVEPQLQANSREAVVSQTNGHAGTLFKPEFKELCESLGINRLPVPDSMKLHFGEELGNGGFGRVYKVSGFPKPKLTAVKLLHDNIAAKGTEEKLKKEIMLMNMCESNYIIKLFAACTVHNLSDRTKSKALIMELMEEDFEKYFTVCDDAHQDKPSIQSIIGILIQVAKGLEYLHSHSPKIVHRDLKACNVLLCNIRGEVPTAKIGDFGLSRFVDCMETMATMTRIAGTRYYLAPEVDKKDNRYNEKIDIFSFGHLTLSACIGEKIEELPDVLDYETGKGRSEVERRDEHIRKLRTSPTKITQVICQCLEYPDFKSRPKAEELVKDLEDINTACPSKQGGDSTDGTQYEGSLEDIN